MKCVICKTGDVRDGTTSVTLQRDETTVVIKQVPAQAVLGGQALHLTSRQMDSTLQARRTSKLNPPRRKGLRPLFYSFSLFPQMAHDCKAPEEGFSKIRCEVVGCCQLLNVRSGAAL
jgi:YgiT-type zinc finger domain-containing protein